VVAAVLVVAGCGDSNAPDLAAVEGDGCTSMTKPLANANVTFTRPARRAAAYPWAGTGAGRPLHVKTVRGKDGAAIGEHKVRHQQTRTRRRLRPSGDAGREDSQAKESLPGRLSSPSTPR